MTMMEMAGETELGGERLLVGDCVLARAGEERAKGLRAAGLRLSGATAAQQRL